MPGEELASPVRELLAVPQVEPLDVVAVLGKRGQGRVPHCLLVGQGDQGDQGDQDGQGNQIQVLNVHLAPVQAEAF